MPGYAAVQRTHDGDGRVVDGDADGDAAGGHVGVSRGVQSIADARMHGAHRRRLPGNASRIEND